MKYLTLIEVIAFLHQHQRAVKTAQHHGKVVEYIEVTLRRHCGGQSTGTPGAGTVTR